MGTLIVTKFIPFYTLFIATIVAHSTVAQQLNQQSDNNTSSTELAISDEANEQRFIRSIASDVLNVIKAEQSLSETKTELEAIFNRTIDIDWVGRFVLGRHWRKADDSQKAQFVSSYRSFMVNSYAERLKEYSGETYDISSPRSLGNDKSALTMTLYRDNGKPVLIDYKVRAEEGQYRIYDIVVEGISLIATQRSEFNSVINRKGLDFLINALEKKSRT